MQLYHVRLTRRDGTTDGDFVFRSLPWAARFAEEMAERPEYAGYRIITVRTTDDAIHKSPDH